MVRKSPVEPLHEIDNLSDIRGYYGHGFTHSTPVPERPQFKAQIVVGMDSTIEIIIGPSETYLEFLTKVGEIMCIPPQLLSLRYMAPWVKEKSQTGKKLLRQLTAERDLEEIAREYNKVVEKERKKGIEDVAVSVVIENVMTKKDSVSRCIYLRYILQFLAHLCRTRHKGQLQSLGQ